MTNHGRPSPLRVRRLLRGLRLRDVTTLSGIPEVSLSRLERGETLLEGRWLAALAELYSTPPEALTAEFARWRSRETRALAAAAEPRR